MAVFRHFAAAGDRGSQSPPPVSQGFGGDKCPARPPCPAGIRPGTSRKRRSARHGPDGSCICRQKGRFAPHPRYPHGHTIFGGWDTSSHNRLLAALDACRRFTLVSRRQVIAARLGPATSRACPASSSTAAAYPGVPGLGVTTAAVRDVGKLRLALAIYGDTRQMAYYI